MLLEVEKKLYNQHLQFHYLSVQTAEIHSKVVNILKIAQICQPNIQLNYQFFQKDYLSEFLEKLTSLVGEDAQDFDTKLDYLEQKLHHPQNIK